MCSSCVQELEKYMIVMFGAKFQWFQYSSCEYLRFGLGLEIYCTHLWLIYGYLVYDYCISAFHQENTAHIN